MVYGVACLLLHPASDAKAHREHVVAVEKAAGLVYLYTTLQRRELKRTMSES